MRRASHAPGFADALDGNQARVYGAAIGVARRASAHVGRTKQAAAIDFAAVSLLLLRYCSVTSPLCRRSFTRLAPIRVSD
ncbi:hypothetical protein PT2222_10275 [Paraburkholderia tropica]